MKQRSTKLVLAGFLIMGLTVGSTAVAKGKDVKSVSKEEQIKLAQSAAPPHISNDATVMVIGGDGKMVEAKKGTNGFTCFPYVDSQEMPDPICMDQPSLQWVNDFMNNAPKPTNSVPGIAYMARGGWHWEKDDKITPTTKNEPEAKMVKEPPHWMVFWPFDSKKSGLSSMPHKFGTYVMYEGTPYSHLMIYQDPNKMK